MSGYCSPEFVAWVRRKRARDRVAKPGSGKNGHSRLPEPRLRIGASDLMVADPESRRTNGGPVYGGAK